LPATLAPWQGKPPTRRSGDFMPVALPLPHVSPAGNVCPPLGEDAPAEGVKLDLSNASEPCTLESEVKAADAGEEGDKGWSSRIAHAFPFLGYARSFCRCARCFSVPALPPFAPRHAGQ